MRRREPSWGSQTASVLILVGFVVVVGFVFLAGVLAGRHWPRLLPSLGGASAAARPEPDPRRVAQAERPPAPVLSFYQDLRAPMTPEPLPPRPRPSPLAAPEPASPETPKPSARERDPVPAVASPQAAALPGQRFTVQVAAFRTRPQAETMRRTLVKGGYDAYVSEGQGPNGARYRVRVGTYPTRDDAQAAARRLAAERRLTTFVTAR